MMKTTFAGALALTLCVGAASAAAQTPIPPSPQDFAIGAAETDQYEILAAEDALAQSRSPKIRAFAQRMIADHGRTLAGLRQAAIASGLTAPPKALSGDQSSLLAALQSLRGEAFDRTYLRQQALVHDQALAVARSYASLGPDGPLRKAAQATAPLIQQHLEMAEALRAGLGGS